VKKLKNKPYLNEITNEGLILGPRGNTQKKMEKESHCKIAIRYLNSIYYHSLPFELNHIYLEVEVPLEMEKAESQDVHYLVKMNPFIFTLQGTQR
jgi:hypothetical protein